MNPIDFARRPWVTTLMLAVSLISGGVLANTKMKVDIFPSFNTPRIHEFLDDIGTRPDHIEGFVVGQVGRYLPYADGVQAISTRSIQQEALAERSFSPATEVGQVMAKVVAISDRAMSWFPKGTLPPMILRMHAGSVPVTLWCSNVTRPPWLRRAIYRKA